MLQTFDFSTVHVDVIVLEADGHSWDKDQAVRALLAEKGFAYHGHIARNDWFTHANFVPSQNPEADANRAEVLRLHGTMTDLGYENLSKQGVRIHA